jgi:hypothetical protein
VGPNPAAAWASRDLGRRLINVRVIKRGAVASIATALEKFSMHMGHVFRTGFLVKIVHVLSAEKETTLQSTLKFCEDEVGWIRFCC